MTVSDRAKWTCEDCGEVHRGRYLDETPDECRECGSEDLDWSYNYGYSAVFPFA